MINVDLAKIKEFPLEDKSTDKKLTIVILMHEMKPTVMDE